MTTQVRVQWGRREEEGGGDEAASSARKVTHSANTIESNLTQQFCLKFFSKYHTVDDDRFGVPSAVKSSGILAPTSPNSGAFLVR